MNLRHTPEGRMRLHLHPRFPDEASYRLHQAGLHIDDADSFEGEMILIIVDAQSKINIYSRHDNSDCNYHYCEVSTAATIVGL